MNTPVCESTNQHYELLSKKQLIALVHQLEKGLIYSTEEINLLRTKIALMNQRTFGRKTESHPNPNQGDLFAQSESQTLNGSVATDDVNQTTSCVSVAIADSESQPTQALVSTHKSKPVKIKPARNQLPDALPREERVIDLEDKSCRHCQSEMTFIGDAISEKLNYIPAVINVIRTVRKKYACQCCECIEEPAMPAEIIDKGIPTDSLLTHIITNKFIYHMPLYRLQQQFKSMGVDIPMSTLCDWVAATAQALKPLADKLKLHLLKESVIHADETPLKILDTRHKKNVTNGYVWAYASSFHSENKIIYYQCAKNRSGQHVIDMLANYTGTLVVDDYSGYKALFNNKPIEEAGCMAHVRRKFVELVKLAPNSTAQHFIDEVAILYHIEARFKHYPAVKRKRARQWLSKPIMVRLKTWLDEKLDTILPSTPLAKAISHALKRWRALEVYLNDGHVPIDNNHIERNIRGIAIGRKNWLFAGSFAAGENMMSIISLLATARANGLNPEQWLRETLAELPTCLNSEINELLPFKPIEIA